MQTGVVMANEFEDVELATRRVLATTAVVMCSTRATFDIQAARVLDERFPGRSDEFRAWITDKAWSQHSELRLRLELPAAQWLAVLAATKAVTSPTPELVAAIESVSDRLVKAGVEIDSEPNQ